MLQQNKRCQRFARPLISFMPWMDFNYLKPEIGGTRYGMLNIFKFFKYFLQGRKKFCAFQLLTKGAINHRRNELLC